MRVYGALRNVQSIPLFRHHEQSNKVVRRDTTVFYSPFTYFFISYNRRSYITFRFYLISTIVSIVSDSSAPNRPPTHENREPNAIPLSLESSDSSSAASKVEDKLNRVSNVKLDDDDFDIESYYARLHAIPSLDASAESEMKKSVVEESSFSEIDLNSPAVAEADATDDGSSQNQGIASDIAQNLSQLPQVLPQVASTVLSSFSSMLNLGRSAKPDQYSEPSEIFDACPTYPLYSDDQSDNIVIPMFNRDEFSNGPKHGSASSHSDVLKSTVKNVQNPPDGSFNVPDSRHISQTVTDKPPSSGKRYV